MFTIYVYVLDTLADWELGHVISELNSGRFFKKDAKRISLKTVGFTKEPIHTMGGLTIMPDCLIDDIAVSETSVLLLPGASSTGALLWAKQIIEHLGVFEANTLEAWYSYFSTGKPEYFFALMQTLPSGNGT